MSEDRRRRSKQVPARKKARGSSGNKRALEGKPPAVVAARGQSRGDGQARERGMPLTAAVREASPVEWARDLGGAEGIADEHPGYLAVGARRLVRRVARAALAPLSLARAVIDRLRDRS